MSELALWPAGKGEMATCLREFDWAATPLKAIADWPPSLREAVDVTLANPVASLLLWGPDHIQIYNDPWRALIGQAHPAAFGQYQSIHKMEVIYARVQRGEAFVQRGTPLPLDHHSDWCMHYIPMRDAEGKVAGILCTAVETSENVIERLESELDQQKRMHAELQHRVRNTMAVVRSIVRMSADSKQTAAELASHIEGRIAAFARVQAVLLRDPSRGIDLEAIVAETLRATVAQEGNQYQIKGPAVLLSAKAAEVIGLALHELTTNAMKFGALSVRRGRVRAAWSVSDSDPQPELVFDWIETDVHLKQGEPEIQGFGMELLTRSLAYQLRAHATMKFDANGFQCRIVIPLAEISHDA